MSTLQEFFSRSFVATIYHARLLQKSVVQMRKRRSSSVGAWDSQSSSLWIARTAILSATLTLTIDTASQYTRAFLFQEPQVPAPSEEILFRTCVRRHAALQLGLTETHHKELDEALKLHYEAGKVMEMHIYDKRQPKIRLYLVSIPLASPRSAGGRATRSYWAVELTNSGQGEIQSEVPTSGAWKLHFASGFKEKCSIGIKIILSGSGRTSHSNAMW